MLFAQKLLNYSTWWVADKNFIFLKWKLFLLLLSGLLFFLSSHRVSGVLTFFWVGEIVSYLDSLAYFQDGFICIS